MLTYYVFRRQHNLAVNSANAAEAVKYAPFAELTAQSFHRTVCDKLEHKVHFIAEMQVVKPYMHFVYTGNVKDFV